MQKNYKSNANYGARRGVFANLPSSNSIIQSTVEKLWKMLRKINKTKQSLATNKAITSLIYSGTRFELSEQFFLRDIFLLFLDGSSIKIMKLKLMAGIVQKRGKYTKRWTFQVLQPTIGGFGK